MFTFCLICLTLLSVVQQKSDIKNFENNEELDSTNEYLRYDKSDWVDPGDMFSYDPHTKSNMKTAKAGATTKRRAFDESECECQHSEPTPCYNKGCDEVLSKLKECETEVKLLKDMTSGLSCNERIAAFTKRALQKLNNQLNNLFQPREEVKVYLLVYKETLMLLEKYTKYEKINCKNIDIFEDEIIRLMDQIEVFPDEHNSWRVYLVNLINSKVNDSRFIMSITCLLLAIFLIYKMYYSSFVLNIFLFIIIMLMMAVGWEWNQLYHAEIAKKQAVLQLPPLECQNPNTLSYFERIRLSLFASEERCYRYYRASMVDPVWEVNPLTAASSLLAKTAFLPLGIAGDSLGEFVNKFFSHIPWYLLPFVGLASLVVVLFSLILVAGYSIRLPLFFGSIVKNREPASNRSIKEKDSSSLPKLTINIFSQIQSGESFERGRSRLKIKGTNFRSLSVGDKTN